MFLAIRTLFAGTVRPDRKTIVCSHCSSKTRYACMSQSSKSYSTRWKNCSFSRIKSGRQRDSMSSS